MRRGGRGGAAEPRSPRARRAPAAAARRMTAVLWKPLELAPVEVLLCDADGNLFPSEEPAFAASVDVTNRLMASLGSPRRFGAEELRLASTGKNFRVTATDLAAAEGVALTPPILEHWVAEERRVVTAHLSRVLRPAPEVRGPLIRLAGGLRLAAVSSSASARLGGCFEATAL